MELLLILETGMLIRSSNIRQKGMTLIEVLIMIAVMALISGLVFTSPLFSSQLSSTQRNTKDDFRGWYQLMGHLALYDSSARRVCLVDNRMIVQRYDGRVGWQSSGVMYIPPQGITLTIQGQLCSPLLNNENDEFVSQVIFDRIS